MVTRAQRGIFKPNPKYAHLATNTNPISPIPKSVRTALRDPSWLTAMQEEYRALLSNRTWELVPRPPGANVVSGKWLFRHKLRADGTLERYKARWVVRGFSQRPGVDFAETFSPVVKSATIRAVLAIAAARNWPVNQMDVNNAFLQGHLRERVYCQQPVGFVDANRPNHVCLLDKSLYGLKQAPRAWFERFTEFLHRLGFVSSKSDASLFVLRRGSGIAYLLLYVDDVVLTASSTALLRQLIAQLLGEFSMKDLGALHYFLGISVTRSSSGFFLSQQQYAAELLDRANMVDCRPVSTPVDTHSKLSADAGAPVDDASEYRSIVGGLQYLTMTRPDLSYAVQQACLHMHDPRAHHLAMVKRIMRYIRGSADHGLHIHRSTDLDLIGYSDADWAGCPDTRRSTSGYAVFLGDSLVSWSSKRQPTVSRSSAEAEYRAVANVVAECCWLRQLLGELHLAVPKATVVYCDNISAVYMAANPVHHRRTKHIELDIHFVREKVALGQLRVLHVPTTQQFADVMTKGLPTAPFQEFRSSLCVRPPDTAAAAGC
jgi:histone deacetylase 1/2